MSKASRATKEWYESMFVGKLTLKGYRKLCRQKQALDKHSKRINRDFNSLDAGGNFRLPF